MSNNFGISDEKLESILDYFVEVILETDDPAELRRKLHIDSESKLGRISQSELEKAQLYAFQDTFLVISGRLTTMMQICNLISKSQILSPKSASDLMMNMSGILNGSYAHPSLPQLLEVYQDQLEVYRTLKYMPDDDEEAEDEEPEPRHDPMPREPYDPIRYE